MGSSAPFGSSTAFGSSGQAGQPFTFPGVAAASASSTAVGSVSAAAASGEKLCLMTHFVQNLSCMWTCHGITEWSSQLASFLLHG